MCRRSRRTVPAIAVAAAVLAFAAAPASFAFDLPADSVLALGGRFDLQLESGRDPAPFPWNYASRSVRDRSRLMLDLFSGRPRYGELYLKATALWAAPRTEAGEVEFDFEQGDYRYTFETPRLGLETRLFANERRYWTGELSGVLLDDDVVAQSEDHYGLRHDGVAGDFRWSAVGAVLGDTWDRAPKFYLVRTGWFGSILQASASYLNRAPAADSLDHHAVLKGEVSAVYRRVGLVAGYAVSGFDDGAFFVPSGDGDGDGTAGVWPDNADSPAPQSGSVFFEARLARVPLGGAGLWSLVGRYESAGDEYRNELGARLAGETVARAALYYAARDVCIDGSLVYDHYRRTRFDDRRSHRVTAGLEGLLANGARVVLRGAYAETDDELGFRTRENFLHAAVRRHGRTVYSALHVMAADFGGATGPQDDRLGLEGRFNLSPRVAVYGRVILSQAVQSRETAYWRLEMWPTENVLATFGYGSPFIGDEPYLLEDGDIGQRIESRDVYFVTVRGDF